MVRRLTCFAALAALLAATAGAAASTVSPASFASCSPVAGAMPVKMKSGSLIFASVDGLRLISARADGSGGRTIFSSSTPVLHPAVSPDGGLIAFDRGTARQVWLMNRNGSNAHFLAVGTTPSFAPDGNQLAIGGARTTPDRYELDLINLNGSGRHAVAVDAAPLPHPSWSPDGKSIAFVGYTREQMDFPSIKRVGADGSGEAGVAIFGTDPSWSSDGRWIAYTNNRDRSLPTEVHAVRPDGSGHRVVARVRNLDAFSPAWSARGTSLLFVTSPAGREGAGTYGGSLWTAISGGLGVHPLAPNCLFGTAGPNRMHGSPRPDRIYTLEGRDIIDVRGGGRDLVDCGPGFDRAFADRSDRVARDCERIARR